MSYSTISGSMYHAMHECGFGRYANRIHGDRVDDSFEGNADMALALSNMDPKLLLFLAKSKSIQELALCAYLQSTRSSSGSKVILEAVAKRYQEVERASIAFVDTMKIPRSVISSENVLLLLMLAMSKDGQSYA